MPLSAGWKKTVDDGIANEKWDAYDALIKRQIDEYNTRLAATPGFANLDWKLFKAMLWVESGGPSGRTWTARPMQIGNPGDQGYGALKSGEGASGQIMSDSLKADLKNGNINDPKLNIRAGIAYALTRLVQSEEKSVDDLDDLNIYTYTVIKGDNLWVVASKVGSTVKSLRRQNPTANALKIGQILRYRKAAIRRVITGWRPVTTATLARYYNVGDSNYAAKLDYVLFLFEKLVR